MEKSSNDYHISFFKPTTHQARANRNLVLWLVSIWFVAIFGFQIVLKIIEKPTPEPAYVSYEDAWANIQGGQFTDQDLKETAKSCLSVRGKINLSEDEISIIDQTVSWSIYQLLSEGDRDQVIMDIQEFERLKASAQSISDEDYLNAKFLLSNDLSEILGLSESDVRKTLLPFTMRSEGIESLKEEVQLAIPSLMSKYLIHNRSVLTDTRFLGFPFHYFYTAVFLLILFVLLCMIYCLRTDAMNKRLEIAD